MSVCDSCMNAFCDEGLTDPEDVEIAAFAMGADIADHECDARGVPDVECVCGCPKQFRDRPAPGKTYRLTGGPKDKALSNGNSWAESEVE